MTELACPVSHAPLEYHLQRMPVGVAIVDPHRRLRSANGFAARTLALRGTDAVGADIVDLHPPQARERVRRLLEDAMASSDGQSTSIVSTPIGNFLARASMLGGHALHAEDCCLILFALGDGRAENDARADALLTRLPIQRGAGGRIGFVDVNRVLLLRARGHYAEAVTADAVWFCPRSLSTLEKRIDPARFFRIHRGHLVNLDLVRTVERVDGQWMVSLCDDAHTRVPVSRQKVAALRERLAL